MPDPDLVRTGIAGLDEILSGGIPRGNVILLEGAIGCGKTTLGVEFIYHGASQFGEPGLIVLFEVSPDKIIRDARHFGWDLRELEENGRLRIVFTSRDVLRQELQQADSVLLEEATGICARRIFIDGVARLIGANGAAEARSAFHVFTEGLQRENLTAALAVEASAYINNGGQNGSLPEESIADAVIRLRMEDNQRAVSRSLEIVKSRGQNYQMGRHTFRISMARESRFTVASRRLADGSAIAPPLTIRTRVSRPESPASTSSPTAGYSSAVRRSWPESPASARA
jgi:circadian clock protein KaiC